MKYVLMRVIEREISVVGTFDDLVGAHLGMLEDMSTSLDIGQTELMDIFLGDAERVDSDIGITSSSGWGEHYGQNYDWKIFALDENGALQEVFEEVSA